MALHKYDDAAAAFERSIAIKNSDIKLNSAAYQLALSNTHLDLAETWAKTAINEVETQLNQITLQTAKTDAPGLLRKCAMYWDTLGWIKFQKEDLAAAETYVRAGWELLDDTTIGYHLARVYETQGRKGEAIETYAQTLAIASAKRELTNDEKDARQHLALLLGGESLVDARVSESRQRLKERRSLEVSNKSANDLQKEYWIMLEPGAKLTELEPSIDDSQFEALAAALRVSSVTHSFPDAGILKLPRAGVFVCSASNRTCMLTLLAAGDSAQSAASSPNGSNP